MPNLRKNSAIAIKIVSLKDKKKNMDSFDTAAARLAPLPERMRPVTLEQYVGQRHLVGEGCILRRMIESGVLSSFILL